MIRLPKTWALQMCLSHSLFETCCGSESQVWLTNQLRKASLNMKITLQNSKHIAITPLSSHQKLNHKSSLDCLVWKEAFTPDNYKVAHHDHLNGDYVGVVWNNCNLHIQMPRFVSIIVHNPLHRSLQLIFENKTITIASFSNILWHTVAYKYYTYMV